MSSKVLRVMTYNILDGGLGREEFLIQIMRATRPDVVILEEVYHLATIERFAQALGMGFFFARGNSKRHLALLSRLPIIASNSYHPFPPIRTTLLEATLQLPSEQKFQVYGVHLLAGPFVPFEVWRQRELETILWRIKSHQSLHYLIVGDFNSLAPLDNLELKSFPWKFKLAFAMQPRHFLRQVIQEVQLEGLIDCFRTLHPNETGRTLPASHPNVRLDYIFASAALSPSLRCCKVVREPVAVLHASDHLPVLAEFEIDDERIK